MVLASILQKVLSKLLGNLFYGIIKQNIKVDLLNGRLTVSNIGLHPNLFENMNLPFDLYYSYVQKIDLIIHLRTEEPLTLNISTIYGILVYKDDWDLRTVNRKKKQAEMKEVITEKIKVKAEKQQTEEDKKGSLGDKISKMLDNIKVNISSIHLRFQSVEKGYSFGIKVEDIVCATINKDGFHQYFNREKSFQDFVRFILDIDPLAIYVNPNQKYFLSIKKQFAQITNAMAQMDRNNNTHSYGRQVVSTGIQNLRFILALTIKAKIRKFFNKSENSQKVSKNKKVETDINFQEIELGIGHEQFHVVIDVINRLTQYQSTCDRYSSRVQINIDKQRDAAQILLLMKRKKGTSEKQKLILKKMVQNHLGWIFRMQYVKILQKKFLREAIKKQVTTQNIFNNPKLERILSKINFKLIKQWTEMAIILRQKYKKKNVLMNTKSQLDAFSDKYIDQMIDTWTTNKVEESQQSSQQEIGLKLFMNIHFMSIKISKENIFGMGVAMKSIVVEFSKRENRNFVLNFSMQDLQVSAFNAIQGQKTKTLIPFLHRNMQLQTNDPHLLSLKFEKSPIGKPFIFSSTIFKFNSIQITVYPEIYQKIYQTFFEDDLGKKKGNQKKVQKTTKKQSNPPVTAEQTQQYNVIQGVVHSPWIVIPISHTNDISKQCWVLRLGDLNIDTNDAFMKRDYYESLNLELKHFQLKYFTSIKYFHTWLNHNMNMALLQKLPNSQQNKIIDVIEPISCYVDLKIMKKYVKQSTRKNKQYLIANIKIQTVFIRLPKIIVDKLKQRVDLFQEQRKTQFIEMNPKNVLQDHILSGIATVTNEKLKKMALFVVLKNSHLYFFMKDKRDHIVFMEDIRENMIRITSDHHSFVNQGKTKKIYLELKDKNQHLEWHRALAELTSKRDRKHDTLFMQTNKKITFPRNQQSASYDKGSNQDPYISEKIRKGSQMYKEKQIAQHQRQQHQLHHSAPTLVNITFVMANLSIQLIDDKNQQFLFCSFDRTKLNYQNMEEKLIAFSISQWKVQEQSKKKMVQSDQRKQIPFLASKRFSWEKKKSLGEKQNNFLMVKASFNQLTGDLADIDINIDQLYISWDIFIFNKILAFFFYSSEAEDAPSVSSTQKKSLKIKFSMNRFYLYCFHEQSELIALFKFHSASIKYSQSKIQEAFEVRCQKFEAEKFIDNDASTKLPMIVCRSNRSMSVLRQSVYDENLYEEDYLRKSNPQTDRQERQGMNPMLLTFTVRRLETQRFPHITKLKKKFGDDLLVSEMVCQWRDTIIYFQQEQTLRLLTYFLNQILGTVASKFKKKDYSQNYINKALQIKKLSTFNAKFTNFVLLIPPHERSAHFFEIIVDQIGFSKNIRKDKPEYEPELRQFQTKMNKAKVFHDTIVFQINGVLPFYKYGSEPSIPLIQSPFNLQVSFSKLSFPRQYQPILKSLDDIDRTTKVSIKIFPSLKLQLHKIMFLTALQIFYQNIKHRDGKATKFQTPHSFPPKKLFFIQIQDIAVKLYEYSESNAPLRKNINKYQKRMSSLETKKSMKVFQIVTSSGVSIAYQNIGSKGSIKIILKQLSGSGQLPLQRFQQKQSYISLEMNSDDGQMTLNVRPVNYQIDVNLDKLTHVLQFINFDSEYTSNKIMPKKTKQSWANISIFPQQCCLKMRNLSATGTFCVTYYKDFKNPVAKKVLQYFTEGLNEQENKKFKQNPSKEISDKQIKVNGQDLKIKINNQLVGGLKNLYFSRLELHCKLGNRKLKKQTVHIGGFNMFASLYTLKDFFAIYDNNIKKSSSFKQKRYFQPCHEMPKKLKSLEKRTTSVQFEKSVIHIVKAREQNENVYFQPYFTIQFLIPKIIYATYMHQQQISIMDLQAQILQTCQKIIPLTILWISNFSLNYFTDKKLNQKKIQIENAKNLRFSMKSINQRLCAYLAKQIKTFVSSMKNPQESPYIQDKIQRLRIDQTSRIVFANLTNRIMEITIRFSVEQKNNHVRILLEPNEKKQYNKLPVQIFNFINMNQQLGFQQDRKGPIIIKKMSQISTKQPIQLFSNSAIQYKVINNGISFQICENSCIWNMTAQPYLLYFLNKSKQSILKEPLLLSSHDCKFFNKDQNPTYLYIQTKNINKPQLLSFISSGGNLIKIQQIPTKQSLRIKPIEVIHIKKQQSKRNKQQLKLIIFNKYKLKNQLPIPVQVNFNKIKPFSKASINANIVDGGNLVFRVGDIGSISLDLINQLKMLQYKTKGKKLLSTQIVQNQFIYEIEIQITKCLRQDQQKSHNTIFSRENQRQMSVINPQNNHSNEDNMVRYNQLLRTSNLNKQQLLLRFIGKMYLKNGSCHTLYVKFILVQQKDAKDNKNNIKRVPAEDYLWIPDNAIGICLYRNKKATQNKQKVNFNNNQSFSSKNMQYIPMVNILQKNDSKSVDNFSKKIWSYLFIEMIKASKKQFILAVHDVCLIQNKTQVFLKLEEDQNNVRINKANDDFIKPNSIGSIILSHQQQQDMRSHAKKNEKIELNIRSKFNLYLEGCWKSEKQNFLTAKTLLPLNIPSSENIIYWSMNPLLTNQSFRKSGNHTQVPEKTKIIKITVNKLVQRYHLIFEEQNLVNHYEDQFQNSKLLIQNLKSNNTEQELQYGYKFYNQMPKGYIAIIQEQDGLIPIQEDRNMNIFNEYYKNNRKKSQATSNYNEDYIQERLSPKQSLANMGIGQYRQKGQQQGSAKYTKGSRGYKLQISRERNSRYQRDQKIEYLLRDGSNICVGLTNLQLGPKTRIFTIQFYREDKNIQYKEKFQLNLTDLPKIVQIIKLKKQKNHSGDMKMQNSNTFTENDELEVGLFVQRKKQQKIEIFIRPMNVVIQNEKPPQKLKLIVNQIALTIEISKDPKDSLTLEFENFNLERVKSPPNSYLQNLSVKLDKMLLREDKTLPIIRMLHLKQRFFTGEIIIQKMGRGEFIKQLRVQQSPLEINIRQGILFKFLDRIVQIRQYYSEKISEDPLLVKAQRKNHKSLREYHKNTLKQLQKSQKASKQLFIGQLWFKPTNIYLSYTKDEYSSNYEDFMNDPIIKYFVLIPGISELKISLPELQAHDFEGTTKQLTKRFGKQIKKNIGSTVFSSLSSISLFDSPVAAIDGFFQYVRAIFMLNNN